MTNTIRLSSLFVTFVTIFLITSFSTNITPAETRILISPDRGGNKNQCFPHVKKMSKKATRQAFKKLAEKTNQGEMRELILPECKKKYGSCRIVKNWAYKGKHRRFSVYTAEVYAKNFGRFETTHSYKFTKVKLKTCGYRRTFKWATKKLK